MTIYSDASPITFADPLPDSVDVVVIGAGVIGICTAWFLARKGISVAVCEKGRVAGEQSSRNWGWVRQHGRDAAELPIMMESIGIWESLAEETGEELGFARCGVLYLAENEAEVAKHEKWVDVARQHQLDTRMLSGREVGQLVKGRPGQFVGAAFTASDGRAEPFIAVPGIARATQRRSVSITENCAVRTLDVSAGSICGVQTETGYIKCSSVVCAGGASASLFVRNHGLDMPQLTIKATVARTAAAPEVFQGNAASSDLAFRRRQDGGYTIALTDRLDHFIGRDSFRYLRPFLPCLKVSYRDFRLKFGDGFMQRMKKIPSWSGTDTSPFEDTRVLNPAPCQSSVALMQQRLACRLPSLAGISLVESWAGMIDTTPDIVPVMDRVDAIPGFYIAAGYCGHGFGIGPGAGRVMADMIMGNQTGHDMTRFRFSRFSDGSAMVPGPAL